MNDCHMRALADARMVSQRDEADRHRIAYSSSIAPDASAVARPARDRRSSFLAQLSRAIPGLEASR